MKDLDLTSLRYFVAACEAGNIARAAELQHVVPSAISKRLARMEAELGVVLLRRQRHGVAPSPAGEYLLERGRLLLADAGRVAQDVSAYGAGVRGQVRVWATVSAIAATLPDDVAGFLQQPEHAAIEVEIEEGLSSAIVHRLKDGSAMLGILWDASVPPEMQRLSYRTDHLAVVVPQDHPLAASERCAFARTLAYDHVGLQSTTAVNRMLLRAAALDGGTLRFRTRVSNFDAALRVVRAGLGISIIPAEIAAVQAGALGLAVVALTDAWATRSFAICFRDRAALPKAAAMLVDYLGAVGAR